MFIMNLHLFKVTFTIELFLRTYEVMFIKFVYIVLDFMFIGKLYLL